ncbi:MAG: nitronate monooxygenase [Rhizobiaceae bacterium]
MIQTRLTRLLDIKHPVLSAPMASAAGGALAAAVSTAGGLGLIGGAYPNRDWIEEEFSAAGNIPVGCGFITWNLTKAMKDNPDILGAVLDRKPRALFLSFGDPAPYARQILQSGARFICQVQTLHHAKHAIDSGAEIIVAQGAEAGGHGRSRATMTLVPEVADYVANNAPNVVVCAAGGIADGRGLAAALMLGAEGVVIGSRFWASTEALVHRNMHEAALAANGDDTIRSTVMDVARKLDWPAGYTARVLKNAFTEKWHNDLEGLLADAEVQSKAWMAAWQAGEVTTANTFVGEATGLINDIAPAGEILEAIMVEAAQRLRAYNPTSPTSP